MRRIAKHVFRMLWGLFAVVLGTAVYGHFCFSAFVALSSWTSGSPDFSLFGHDIFWLLFKEMGAVAILTFPLWFIGSIVSEMKAIRRKIWFVKTAAGYGAVTAVIFSIYMMQMPLNGANSPWVGLILYFGLAAIGGALGGLLYWSIAGRHSGDWKSSR
jgi:hypothetical protein